MESHDRNRIRLLPYQPLSSRLGRHNSLLELDLLLEHVLDALDVVNVVLIDVQVSAASHAVALFVDLTNELPLVV